MSGTTHFHIKSHIHTLTADITMQDTNLTQHGLLKAPSHVPSHTDGAASRALHLTQDTFEMHLHNQGMNHQRSIEDLKIYIKCIFWKCIAVSF